MDGPMQDMERAGASADGRKFAGLGAAAGGSRHEGLGFGQRSRAGGSNVG